MHSTRLLPGLLLTVRFISWVLVGCCVCVCVCVSHINVTLFSLVDSLLESGAITKSKHGIHKIVMGKEEFTAKDIVVQAHAFSASAREAIEQNGGKCQMLKRTTGEVIAA